MSFFLFSLICFYDSVRGDTFQLNGRWGNDSEDRLRKIYAISNGSMCVRVQPLLSGPQQCACPSLVSGGEGVFTLVVEAGLQAAY